MCFACTADRQEERELYDYPDGVADGEWTMYSSIRADIAMLKRRDEFNYDNVIKILDILDPLSKDNLK